MTELKRLMEQYVSAGSVPGAVALVAHGGRVEVEAVGSVDVDGTSPMARDSIFRGTGTTGHLTPSSGSVAILLTQAGMQGPTTTPLMRDFWRFAAQA